MPGLLAPSHIILLALAALILFGPKRLPEIGRSLGRGMREFKNSIAGDDDDGPLAREDPAVDASAPAGPDPEPPQRASGVSSGSGSFGN